MQNLHFAVLSKNNQIVELILPDHKDVVNQQDADGNSALLLACRDGLEEIAITLLENGGSPFIVNGVSFYIFYDHLVRKLIARLYYDLVWKQYSTLYRHHWFSWCAALAVALLYCRGIFLIHKH